jgi:uncharacterized protein YceK
MRWLSVALMVLVQGCATVSEADGAREARAA